MIFAVDFDGTCVTHEYPKVGKNIGAEIVLKKLVEDGHKIILFTMRCKEQLEEAKQWFTDNGIALFGVNTNPTQHTWTASPKPYAHVYIDDAGLGTPVRIEPKLNSRPFVDWALASSDLGMIEGVFRDGDLRDIFENLAKTYPEIYGYLCS